MTLAIPEQKKIILFDGVCNLCNNAVQTIIKNDKKNVFVFAALQSEMGNTIVKHLGIDTITVDSIILYEPGIAYYIKSTAALKIAKEFSGAWKLLRLCFVFPERFRDVIYDFIARNRYQWFGKKDQCMIPTPELEAKFLS